ncbi:DUF6781 family protein [Nitrosophilus alvini]|uniref:DUF6781 family protein n=1 Tax=Nitrosophilus alvini TaxID=2714855 RepID=UPI00190D20E5|nr:DUF6781 family protein [Nitrosophilus alvini]
MQKDKLLEDLAKTDDLKDYVENLVKDAKKEKEEKIEELLKEKDRIEHEIDLQKEQIKHILNDVFETLEEIASELEEEKREILLKSLEESKLRSLEFLGILKETTEAAILTVLEKGEDVEDTIREITKNITFESLSENRLDLKHIEDVSKTILTVSAEIAAVSLNYSDEILKGSVYGVKQGVAKSIAKFKESLEFTPIEAREMIVTNYEKIIEDLEKVEDLYSHTIKNVALKADVSVRNKLLKLAEEMERNLTRLASEANEAIETLKTTFSEFAKEAASKSTVLKEKAEEAKKLGLRAFSTAKAAVEGAIKGAKEAIAKEQKDDKER